jgi:hypothetical protein
VEFVDARLAPGARRERRPLPRQVRPVHNQTTISFVTTKIARSSSLSCTEECSLTIHG